MNVSDMFPSKYLKAADLRGQEAQVQIERIEQEQIGRDKEKTWVLYFVGKNKSLCVNKTNAITIAAALGDDSTGWIGKSIVLFSTMTQFGADVVACIRVRAVRPAAIAAPVAAPPADVASAEFQQAANSVPPSNDIPF